MEEMEILLELQEYDLELMDLEDENQKIPALMAELDSGYNELEGEIDAQEEELKSLKVQVREAEGRIAQLDEKEKKYRQQLLEVKTNKEYSALLTEIENVKREKNELEELIIEGMEKSEELASGLDEKKARLEELAAERKGRKDELEQRKKELESKIATLKNKRVQRARDVGQPLLRLYDRIMKGRVSNPVVALRNGSCSGCYGLIPLQKINDIRRGGETFTCDHCGRILYYDESRKD